MEVNRYMVYAWCTVTRRAMDARIIEAHTAQEAVNKFRERHELTNILGVYQTTKCEDWQ